jgi:hypothetical protein
MRPRGLFAAASCALVLLLPLQSRAAQIPSQEVVAGTVSTTTAMGSWTSVFDGAGAPGTLGAHLIINHGGVKVRGVSAGVTEFHMTVTASVCCTVHAFVLSPWTGTWSVDGSNGDTLSGTVVGAITAACVSLSGFCATPPAIGPFVSFALTITGGTGRYAGATGSGSLSGAQTIEDAYDLNPIPPAAFVGMLTLSVT